MHVSMWTLTRIPILQEYPELQSSLPSLSTCTVHAKLIRRNPSKSALTFATCRHPCLQCHMRMSICFCNVEKTVFMGGDGSAGGDGWSVLRNSFVKFAHKTENGTPHTAELCKVWAAPRRTDISSEDCHMEQAGGGIVVLHDNIVEAGLHAKDIEHTGEQGNMCGDARTTDISSESHYMSEARSGLAVALCNSGLSQKDSDLIASKAPITVQSLVNAAFELDEFATWIDQQPPKQQDLRQKVIELAMANRSRQFSALLESIGVGERHISRVCHFLASQHIADVLQKIRLLEDAFPNEKSDIIVMRTRRMMREMSLSVDGGLQRSLSLFEKMEAKRGGISKLNIPREAMPYVIEEFPQVLVRDLDSDLKALAGYFEEIGVPKESISCIYMCFPSILLYRSIEELQRRLRTLKKETSVRPRNFGRMVVKYPWILSRCVEDNVKAVAAFLLSAQVPPGKVGQCITRCPNLLGSSTTCSQAMVQQLISIGVKSRTIGNILTHYPQLLLKTQRSFLEIVKFLKNWGLEESHIPKLLVRCPPVFASTVPFLRKKITFLQQLGIRNQRLKCVLQRYPEVLMLSLENSLKPRLMFFKSMGLSNEDVAFMICGFPPLLGYSIESVLRPKLDVLQNVLCHPVKEVVLYPRYFSYSLEKKILPRYRILKRSSVEWDLKSMLSTSDDQFAQDHLGFKRMLVPPV